MLNLIVDALLPPASFAVLAFLLLLGGRRSRKLGLATLATVLFLGMPAVPALLMSALTPAPVPGGEAPQAIVLLSADWARLGSKTELDPGLLSLDRIRAAAALQRRTHLPLLVSGGSFGGNIPLAEMMARSLRQDFGVDVTWAEDRSRDTWENARFSAAMLKQAGISRVYVVTHVWHMRRALLAFRRFGLEATPAPVRPGLPVEISFASFIPRAISWEESFFALHEWTGLAYYALRR